MPGWRSGRLGVAWGALAETVKVAYQTRVTGLAAEASFWGIFALPWLALGLVAGIAMLEPLIGADALTDFEANTISLARRVLTPRAIDELLKPFLESILAGRGTLSFFGFLVAIYAGSRLIGTLTDGMAIVYRQEGIRSFVRARVLSLGVYAVGLVGLIVVIPLVVLGPGLVTRILPSVGSGFLSIVLVIGQLLLVIAAIVSLYHVATPHRTPWPADIPGALLALALFSAFSYLLRWYFGWLFRDGSVYGAISAPIAIMWWVYVTNLALLLGAAFNGALAVRNGWYPQPRQDPATIPEVRGT